MNTKIDIDLKINIDELIFYFPRPLGEISIDTTPTWIKMQDMKTVKWNLVEDVQIHPLNLGICNEPQVVKLNVDLDPSVAYATKQLLKEYKDVFAWTYKDLKGIPPYLVQYRIKLNTNIFASHQAWY